VAVNLNLEQCTMNQTLRFVLVGLGIVMGGTAYADVTFFERDNFAGREMTVNQTVANFDRTGFNDRARSAIVNSGQWEVCVDADFGGSCQVLGPGRYPDLGGLAGRVSSVRPASTIVTNREGAGYRPGPGNYGGARDSGARATLYEGRNLSGRSFALRGGTMANLDGTGFNDRASSLRVEGGYWVFCSDANFGGECRTFGPGEYASLPSGLNNMISSGRRISDDYPYNQNPTWQR
jgi:Beta/Gamma crystallin